MWIAALVREFRDSREGAVAIYMAFILVILLGMTGLAVEVGLVLYKRQQQQTAADTAASAGALALRNGESATAATDEAKAIAAQSGYVNGANGVVVTFNNPPLTPPAINTYLANAAVQAIIQQPQTLILANLVTGWYGTGPINWNVQASAVANVGGSSACVAQLLPGQNPGVTINNGATVTLQQCGLQVCSKGNTALSMSGGTHLNLTEASGNLSDSQTVSVAGNASVTNGAQINNKGSCSAPSCKASQGACAPGEFDPYVNVQPNLTLPPAGCSNGTNKSYGHSNSGLQTLKPGVWCNGVSFTNDAQIKLNPGVYYVNKGNFNVGGNVHMDGTAVTIVLTGSGSNYATVTIGNGATVNLSAPTIGITAGIAFFGDNRDPWSSQSNQQQTFGGGAVMNINGAIYFPSTQVNFNNGITNPAGCTQLIAGTINFQGGADFSNNCAGTGTIAIGGGGGGPNGLVE
jgi:Flp pilus assembly protein TadG